MASFLVHLIASTRMRDIGIMKASGCLNNSVFAYFFTELSIIVIISTIAGTVLGIVTYYGTTALLNVAGFSFSQNLDITAIIVVVVFSLFSLMFLVLYHTKSCKNKTNRRLIFNISTRIKREGGKQISNKIRVNI